MRHGKYLFSSESVSEGHPDKVCDRISDTVLDYFLALQPAARVGCEAFSTTGRVIVGGEFRVDTPFRSDVLENLIREAIRDIGYDQEGFSWKTVEIENLMHAQSADIARGVDSHGDAGEGAGDQGIMFGYACNETSALMPAPIFFAHSLLSKLADLRKSGELSMLGPDAKTQLTFLYENGKPKCIDTIVISTQHLDASLTSADIRELIEPHVLGVVTEKWATDSMNWHVNPTGKFTIGGPDGDAGLTGRKLIVDTYGGAAPHGGGAFSGKDPTKVDRSAAYMARYIAKNVVAAGLADICQIQLAYAIGVQQPVSMDVRLFNAKDVDEVRVEETIREMLDLSPRGILGRLNLSRPIYTPTSAYGHFGREPTEQGNFSWERLDLVDDLRSSLGY